MSRTIVPVAALFAIITVGSCTDSTEPEQSHGEVVLTALTPIGLTGVVGQEIDPAPSVVALDENGKPVAGVSISFSASGLGSIGNLTSITDKDGKASVDRWTLGPRSGPQWITARSVGLKDVVFIADALPGPAASMQLVSGDNQLAAAGYLLSKPLRVLVADDFGNPVTGARVTFEILSGDGSIGAESVATDSNGIASSSSWQLGSVSGTQQVTARSGSAEIVFRAEALPVGARSSLLLFVRNERIYSLEIGTGITRQITDFGRDGTPAFSPDGRRIAFMRQSTDWISDIWVMDADGSNLSRRTTGLNVGFPAWSPDGRTLAVAKMDIPSRGEIYLLSAVEDGKLPVKIANDASMPAWSPDGKRIAFVSLGEDDGYHALHLANTDGTDVTEIVPRRSHTINHPVWSPDGSRIAFSECDFDETMCRVNVVTVDGARVWETAEEYARWPAWSPDGRWIAFSVRNLFEGERIAFTDAKGGGELHVFSDGYSPSW